MAEKTNHFILLDEKYSGECSGSIIYGPKEDEILHDLETAMKYLKTLKTADDGSLNEVNALEINPVTKAGVLTAVLHKVSGEKKQYPWQVLGVDPPDKIRTSFTVSIDNPDSTLECIKATTYPIIKLKMGSEYDDDIIRVMKQIPSKKFRVDANGGWDPEKAERMVHKLSRLNVEIIEQPTGVEYIGEWPHIKGSNNACLMVDEGLYTVTDYERYCDFVDGINIKMAKSGGVVEAIKIAQRARKNGRKVMFGCMVESSVAIAQSVYLASLADFFDLDGPLLIKQDMADGLIYKNESINVDENIIGGPKLKKEFIREHEIES